jgi:hypothetical protein
MTDKVFDEIMQVRATGEVNMLPLQEVFELALRMDCDDLADYIFTDTHNYVNFILTGQRD